MLVIARGHYDGWCVLIRHLCAYANVQPMTFADLAAGIAIGLLAAAFLGAS